MTWQRVAVFVALIVMLLAGCYAGSDSTATTSSRSPGTSESSLWPPCRGVNDIGYAYVTQTGPLMLGRTARSATTTSRTLAEDLFVATCKAVALDVKLPSGPIDCPEETGSRVLGGFSSHPSSPPEMRMTLFDSGCEFVSMTTPSGQTQMSAIFRDPDVLNDTSHIESYLVAILRG